MPGIMSDMMVQCTSEQQHQIRILTNTVHTLSSTVLETKQEHAQSHHSTNQHANTQQTLGGNNCHRHISGDTSHHVCGGNCGSVNISPSESGSGRGGDVLHNPGDVVDIGGNNDISNGNDGAFGCNDTGDDAFCNRHDRYGNGCTLVVNNANPQLHDSIGVVPVLHIGGNSLHGGIDAGAGVVDASGHVGCSPSTTGGGDGLGSHHNNDKIGGSSIDEVGVSHSGRGNCIQNGLDGTGNCVDIVVNADQHHRHHNVDTDSPSHHIGGRANVGGIASVTITGNNSYERESYPDSDVVVNS